MKPCKETQGTLCLFHHTRTHQEGTRIPKNDLFKPYPSLFMHHGLGSLPLLLVIGKVPTPSLSHPRCAGGCSIILRGKGRPACSLQRIQMEIKARQKESMCKSVSRQVAGVHILYDGTPVQATSVKSSSRASGCPLCLGMCNAINLFVILLHTASGKCLLPCVTRCRPG